MAAWERSRSVGVGFDLGWNDLALNLFGLDCTGYGWYRLVLGPPNCNCGSSSANARSKCCTSFMLLKQNIIIYKKYFMYIMKDCIPYHICQSMVPSLKWFLMLFHEALFLPLLAAFFDRRCLKDSYQFTWVKWVWMLFLPLCYVNGRPNIKGTLITTVLRTQ